MTWLASGFEHPRLVELRAGRHLRPIRAGDVAIDYSAVMGVVDQLAGSELARALDDFVPRWLADTWGFESVHYAP